MIEEKLINILLGDKALSDLVGSRVRPVVLSQTDILPAITIQNVSTDRSYALEGPSGLVSNRVQIDAWAETYSETKALSRAILRVLNGRIDKPIQATFLLSETDGSEEAPTNRVFRTRQDYQVIYQEAF